MNKFTNIRSIALSRVIFPVAVLGIGLVQSANAILTMDLRAVSITPGAGTINNTKSVSINASAGANTVVTFELWGVVTGADADGTNDTLTSAGGLCILSSPATGTFTVTDTGVAGNQALRNLAAFNPLLKGALLNTLVAPWDTASTTKPGLATDLDGDGDLDIGANVASTSVNYIQTNAGGPQTGGTAGNFNQLSNGREWKLTICTFTITDVIAGAATAVNAVFAANGSLNESARASYAQDGATKTGADANIAVASPITLQVVPEPSVAITLLGGVATLLGLRRRKY